MYIEVHATRSEVEADDKLFFPFSRDKMRKKLKVELNYFGSRLQRLQSVIAGSDHLEE